MAGLEKSLLSSAEDGFVSRAGKVAPLPAVLSTGTFLSGMRVLHAEGSAHLWVLQVVL